MAEVEGQVKTEASEVSLIGQKRQNTEDGGPASKKANLPESDNLLQIKVLIPSAVVGALVGKGGETMRNLMEESGCRMKMFEDQDVYHGTTERVCMVKGKSASVMIVMSAILDKIQQNIEAIHPDPFDLEGQDRAMEMKFVVLSTSTGIVIDLRTTNDASISAIRESANASIQTFSWGRVITVGHESKEKLLSAVQQVLELVGRDPLHAAPIPVDASQSSLQAFLDNLQSTLRSSGFNDHSVSEVMQAMQVLDKYNIMGLDLGLGVAAMARMRNTESALGQQNVVFGAQNSSSSLQQQHQQRYDQSNLMSGGGGGSMLDTQGNLDQPNNAFG